MIERDDFLLFLKDFGFNAEDVRALSENKDDMIDLPKGVFFIEVKDSSIEGKGVFATNDVKDGMLIAPARVDLKRTICGRYTNHSHKPNARMERGFNLDIVLVAIEDICSGQEITIDYREAVLLNNSILNNKTPMLYNKNLPEVPATINLDIFYNHSNDPIKLRSLILDVEEELLNTPDIQLQIETTHKFCEGLYLREVFIPKNTILTGKIHKHSCMNVCSYGDITIITEDGIKRVGAGFSTPSRPGIKRLGFAHEDTVWVNVYATEKTDIKELEEDLYLENFLDIETPIEKIDSIKTMEGYVCQEQLPQEQ